MNISGNGCRVRENRCWTPDEDDFLRENWKELSPADLADLFGTSVPAVQERIRSLGLRRAGRPPLWTPEEDAAVRAGFSVLGPSGLARELGRTETAVRIRAGRFGLKLRSRRLWSRDEVCRLGELIRKGKTIAESARILGRPVASVQLKLRTMGLRSSRSARPWTPDQTAILRDGLRRGHPLKVVGAMVGRTPGACRQKACRLGLLRRPAGACLPVVLEDVQGGVQ